MLQRWDAPAEGWIDTCFPARQPKGVQSEDSKAANGQKISVFPVACWFLALMAFVQLMVAGMALATRFEESRVVQVVEKEVPRPVIVRVPAPASEPSLADLPPVAAQPIKTIATPEPLRLEPAIPPTPLKVPQVADPWSERMVNEAREARVAGDMGRAIVKLQEALAKSPDDAGVHYELGLVHEQMGVFDLAAAHYEKVFQMGATGAGALYAMAAAKLRDGFETPDAMLGKLSLGRVRIFKNPNHASGKQVILTVPVQKSPTEEIDITQIAVEVIFFNRTSKGEIVQLQDKSWVTEQWMSLPFDWVGGEESLRMTYTVPRADHETEQLFGGNTYYGQVVSLTYAGEVLDVQAWPRDLAARIPKQPSMPQGDLMLPEFQDSMPPDFDPELGVLPELPAE